jgi:hypothetical protein
MPSFPTAGRTVKLPAHAARFKKRIGPLRVEEVLDEHLRKSLRQVDWMSWSRGMHSTEWRAGRCTFRRWTGGRGALLKVPGLPGRRTLAAQSWRSVFQRS